MKRGFTLIELLVASVLMGILVTILTMLFNQSSIAWRLGVAGVVDLDEVRDNIAEVRDEADNIYVWNDEQYRLLGLFAEDGSLRQRAWDIEGAASADRANFIRNRGEKIDNRSDLSKFKPIGVGAANKPEGYNNYTVNVKSAGPNQNLNDDDDIWSFPDDIML